MLAEEGQNYLGESRGSEQLENNTHLVPENHSTLQAQRWQRGGYGSGSGKETSPFQPLVLNER